jgi:hypothetical protein
MLRSYKIRTVHIIIRYQKYQYVYLPDKIPAVLLASSVKKHRTVNPELMRDRYMVKLVAWVIG